MISVKLNDVLYLRANLALKQEGTSVVIYNDGIVVREVEYDNSTTARTKFDGIASTLATGTTFYLDLDTLLAVD